MTPDQARALLDGTTPGPWEWRWDTGLTSLFGAKGESVATDLEVQDSDLASAAPTLAAMIAGMRPEYAVRLPDGQIVGAGWGTYDTALEDQNAWRRDGYDTRIVRRYVTEPEEA